MFKLASKVNRESASFLKKTGRAFQAKGPAWQNARPPYVDSRRCRWPSMLETVLQSSARYPAAMLCWHLYTLTHSLNRIRSLTSTKLAVVCQLVSNANILSYRIQKFLIGVWTWRPRRPWGFQDFSSWCASIIKEWFVWPCLHSELFSLNVVFGLISVL